MLALSGVYASRKLGTCPLLPVAAGEVLGGLLVMVPLSLFMNSAGAFDPSVVSPSAWLAVFFSGSIGLGASFVLLAKMLRQHGPTASLLGVNVTPLAATGFGVLLLGEMLTPSLICGAALVMAGIYLFGRD
jgi:drug/metabolite transporter (DMT)-like permease